MLPSNDIASLHVITNAEKAQINRVSSTRLTIRTFGGDGGTEAGGDMMLDLQDTGLSLKRLNDDKASWTTLSTCGNMTYSTTDLTAGTSALTTGKYYFVYE